MVGPAIRSESQAQEQVPLAALLLPVPTAPDGVCRRHAFALAIKQFRVVALHHLLHDRQEGKSIDILGPISRQCYDLASHSCIQNVLLGTACNGHMPNFGRT